MTRGCVSARKEAVWVLLGRQYRSQCGSKKHQCVICHLETKFCHSCQQVLLHSLFTLQNVEVSLSLGERNFNTPVHADFVLRRATQYRGTDKSLAQPTS